jgi:hypothetical protein
MANSYDVCVKWTITGFFSTNANNPEEAKKIVCDMNDGNGPNMADAEDLETTFEIANTEAL